MDGARPKLGVDVHLGGCHPYTRNNNSNSLARGKSSFWCSACWCLRRCLYTPEGDGGWLPCVLATQVWVLVPRVGEGLRVFRPQNSHSLGRPKWGVGTDKEQHRFGAALNAHLSQRFPTAGG